MKLVKTTPITTNLGTMLSLISAIVGGVAWLDHKIESIRDDIRTNRQECHDGLEKLGRQAWHVQDEAWQHEMQATNGMLPPISDILLKSRPSANLNP